jgi:antiviral defense system Shedu protein SduA
MTDFQTRPASAEDYWRGHLLREFHVRHMGLSVDVITAFQACVNDAADEKPVQTFLEAHPELLVQLLHAAPRFVLPRHRLGGEFIPDFIVGEHSSDGYDWLMVELENPRLSFFTHAGDPRAQLTHAIRQIQDWRAWLHRNQNYASRPRTELGLGLIDITADVPGIILMGRRALLDSNSNARRRQMASDLKIRIHTYDHLIEVARASASG